MKKTIILILIVAVITILLSLIGCSPKVEEKNIVASFPTVTTYYYKTPAGFHVASLYPAYDITVVDGCEYVHINGEHGIAHKGNCTNSIHIYNH